MPRIRFLQAVAGNDFSFVAGEEVDMPAARAEAWADGVRAELVRGEPMHTPEIVDGGVETTDASPDTDAGSRAKPPRKPRKPPANRKG